MEDRWDFKILNRNCLLISASFDHLNIRNAHKYVETTKKNSINYVFYEGCL